LKLFRLILPCICTEETIDIGVELENGDFIVGQNDISHPVLVKGEANVVTKELSSSQLPAPIKRLFYYDRQLQKQVVHTIHLNALSQIRRPDAVLIYGMGNSSSSWNP
jgi:hypothetical protein